MCKFVPCRDVRKRIGAEGIDWCRKEICVMKKYEAPVAEVIDFEKDYVLAVVTPRDSYAGGPEDSFSHS